MGSFCSKNSRIVFYFSSNSSHRILSKDNFFKYTQAYLLSRGRTSNVHTTTAFFSTRFSFFLGGIFGVSGWVGVWVCVAARQHWSRTNLWNGSALMCQIWVVV